MTHDPADTDRHVLLSITGGEVVTLEDPKITAGKSYRRLLNHASYGSFSTLRLSALYKW